MVTMLNKWSKNFDETPHRMGAIFTEEKLMWHRPVGNNAVGCNSLADAVIDFFAASHRSSDAQCFSVGRTTFKIALPFGGSGPPLYTWFLGLTRVTCPSGISIGSAVLQSSRTWQQTDMHTYRPRYSVCSNSPHLVIAAIRPKNECCFPASASASVAYTKLLE